MRCHTVPEQGGRTSPVHLQCLTQYPSSRILHCVQPSLLHQPAHLVHMGSLLAPVFHGHQMARRNWRYICSPQREPTCWSPSWFPAPLDWRSRMWPVVPQWYSTVYVSPSALYHAHELPWGPSQSQHASLRWSKSSFALPTWFLFSCSCSCPWSFLVLFPTYWLFFSTWLQLYHDQTWFPACRLHVSFIFHEHATSSLMEIS